MAAKPKAKSGKDYMKPVGGTKQEGYMAPGSILKATGKYSARGKVGASATDKKGVSAYFTAQRPNEKLLKTGINPTAMKATSGNPKPTKTQLAAAKKANASRAKNKLMETQAQKKRNTKPVKGSTKGSTLTSPKPNPSPTTGVYKRNPGS
jgi:hypothetical protein